MNGIEEIKKSLYESYKWLYETAISNVRDYVQKAKERRELGRMDWAADWLTSANNAYKNAISYKRSMEFWGR